MAMTQKVDDAFRRYRHLATLCATDAAKFNAAVAELTEQEARETLLAAVAYLVELQARAAKRASDN